VPGCSAGGSGDVTEYDYCITLPSLVNKGDTPTVKLGQCEGDCDSDADCKKGLVCYHRDTSADLVPGCSAGGSGDTPDHD